jgi:hypothetical protein
MDVQISQPAADAGPALSSHEQLAQGFAAELAAERNPPKPEPAETAPETQEIAETEAPQEATAVEADESEAQAEDTATAEADDAAETPSDVEPIAAPSGMSEADKQAYAKLPSEMKAWIAKQASSQTADYTRKTQEVAAQRKQLETGVNGVLQRLQALDTELAKYTDNVVPPPDPALRNTDPMAYDEQLAQHMHSKHVQELAFKERQRLQNEHAQVSQAMQVQFNREREQQLREKAPELFGENGNKIGKQIQTYAFDLGYTAEQLKAASANDILTLYKAQRFDAIEAAKKNVKTVPPPVLKSSKPGPAKAVGRNSGLANAVTNLATNPSRSALAAAFAAEIASERR